MIAFVVVVAIGGALSSDDEESTTTTTAVVATTGVVDSTTPSAAGTLPCEGPDGLPFETALDSCEEADALGRQLAAQVGLASAPEMDGAGSAYSLSCYIIQGDDVKTYELTEYFELATLLDEQGVCPGDLSMLVPIG